MQYLVSVIDDRTNSGTAGGGGGDRRVQRPAPGRWPLGVRGRPRRTRDRRRSSTAEVSEPMFTDGPFVESKEHIAGFWIIDAPDLDVALALMADGSKACNRRVEVRPFLVV